ncbi:hypothetical protein ES703_65439 [subsurface metagenome]
MQTNPRPSRNRVSSALACPDGMSLSGCLVSKISIRPCLSTRASISIGSIFVPSKIGNKKLQSKIPLYPAGNDDPKAFGYFIVGGYSKIPPLLFEDKDIFMDDRYKWSIAVIEIAAPPFA